MEFAGLHPLDIIWTALFASMAWSLWRIKRYVKADHDYVTRQAEMNETF